MESPAQYYNRLKNFLLSELWRADVTELGMLRHYGYRILRLLFVMVREFSNGQLNLLAMSLVYTSLLSLVPLLAVSFSVLKAFGVHNQVEPLLLNLVAPLGVRGNEVVANILGFVENMKVGVLGSVGLALLLYTVVSLIQKVESSFNYVWHAKSTRPLSRRFSDYLSVILIGPVLVFSAIGMTASMMNSRVVQTLLAIEPFGSLVVSITEWMPYFLVILAFAFVYLFVPNTRVNVRSAIIGAVVGGTLWQSTGMVFASFASSSTRYDAIYSGFAILILFMIWLYLSWLILLLGAQVAYFHQYPEQIRLSSRREPLTGRFREQLGLLMMYWIAERFVHDGKPMTMMMLANKLAIPGDRADEVLALLQEKELVIESVDEPPEYLLLHDPANITIDRLMHILRMPDEEQSMIESRIHAVPAVSMLLQRMELGVKEHLAGMTLRDLVLTPPEELSDTD